MLIRCARMLGSMQQLRAPKTKCSVIGAQPRQNGETRRSSLCQAGQTCCDGELMNVLFCKGVDVERMNVGEMKKRRSLSEVVAPADWSRLSNI